MDTEIEEGGVFASQEAIFLKSAFLLALDELGPEFDLDEAAKSKLAKIVASVAQADAGRRRDDERRGCRRGGCGIVLEIHRAEGRLTRRGASPAMDVAAPIWEPERRCRDLVSVATAEACGEADRSATVAVSVPATIAAEAASTMETASAPEAAASMESTSVEAATMTTAVAATVTAAPGGSHGWKHD